MEMSAAFYTISMYTVKREYEQNNGGYWFSKDTMRFFRSRLSDHAYIHPTRGRAFFVSSEQNHGFGGPYPRLYTVRMYDLITGDINEAPGHTFQEYKSRTGADKAAFRLASH